MKMSGVGEKERGAIAAAFPFRNHSTASLLKKGTAKTLKTLITEDVQRKCLRPLPLNGGKSSFGEYLLCPQPLIPRDTPLRDLRHRSTCDLSLSAQTTPPYNVTQCGWANLR